jgi:hypothetical protein
MAGRGGAAPLLEELAAAREALARERLRAQALEAEVRCRRSGPAGAAPAPAAGPDNPRCVAALTCAVQCPEAAQLCRLRWLHPQAAEAPAPPPAS